LPFGAYALTGVPGANTNLDFIKSKRVFNGHQKLIRFMSISTSFYEKLAIIFDLTSGYVTIQNIKDMHCIAKH